MIDALFFFPEDIILLVLAAFLLSISHLRLSGLSVEKFLQKRFICFAVILPSLFLVVGIFNYWAFQNTPWIYCNVWEEGCVPLAIANTHAISLLVFNLSMLYFFASTVFIKAVEFLDKTRDKRKKRSKIKNYAKYIVVFSCVYLVILGFIIGGDFIFLEENEPIQPLIYLHDEINEGNAIFYFKNNVDNDKMIREIEVFCKSRDTGDWILVNDWNYSWNCSNCQDLPKIIPAKKIETITCKVGEYDEQCDDKISVVAHTYEDKYYSTIFVKQN